MIAALTVDGARKLSNHPFTPNYLDYRIPSAALAFPLARRFPFAC